MSDIGTIEPLMTAPVRDWQVVLSKFFGALVFYVILWLPTLLYFWVFQSITHQSAANSTGAYLGAYLMLFLLGIFLIVSVALVGHLAGDGVAAFHATGQVLCLVLIAVASLILARRSEAFDRRPWA